MISIAPLIATAGASFEAEDDVEQASAYCYERGWTDGLPVIAPTVARVERMLAYCNRPYDQPIARLAPRYGEATPLRIAANAVMAGCRPQYLPVIMLALEAMTEEPFNLYGIQATTHSCAPLILVNGPIAKELGMGCGQPLTMSLIYSRAPEGRSGEALGLRVSINNLMHIVVPLLFGTVGSLLGVAPVFIANALILGSGGVLIGRGDRK